MPTDARPWSLQGEEKRRKVEAMFAEIAPRYDLLNSILSFRLHHRWRSEAVRSLRLGAGGRALDVCCGTGDFARALRRAVGPSGLVVGVDFCLPMLQIAERKGDGASYHLGDACSLPVAPQSVDGVTVGWGIRNVPDIDHAHREAFRVLRSGGRFASLDMARPRNRAVRWLCERLWHRGSRLLGRFFGFGEAYAYLPESTARFWDRERLATSMREAGFVDVEWRDFLFGNICLHTGRRP